MYQNLYFYNITRKVSFFGGGPVAFGDGGPPGFCPDALLASPALVVVIKMLWVSLQLKKTKHR